MNPRATVTVHHRLSNVFGNSGLTVTTAGFATVLIGLLLCACTPAQVPSVLAEVCVHNDEGISQFRSELKALATERQMDFVEDSDNLKRHFELIGYVNPGQKKDDPAIHMVVEHKDGLGVSALNIGLHTYQLALVFSGGQEEAELRQFSEEVIARLRQKWEVKDVPKGSSVSPNDNCR